MTIASRNIAQRAQIEQAVLDAMPALRRQRQKAWVKRCVDLLMLVDGSGPGTPPPGFRNIGRDATRRELEQLADLAEQVSKASDADEHADLMEQLKVHVNGKDHVGGLHQTTIVALANAGVLIRSRPLPMPERLEQAAKDALGNLRQVKLRSRAGKPKDVRAGAVAAVLAAHWRYIVGRCPGYSTDPLSGRRGGPFVRFMTNVFAVLAIKANAVNYARRVVASAPKRRRSPVSY